jgi:hypothetical protein
MHLYLSQLGRNIKNSYKDIFGNKDIWIFLLIVILFISAVILSSVGIRGSDQYWYLADVESLINGVHKTNHLYSGLIMDDSSVLVRRPFLHDILTLYFVLPFALIFGPYMGWVILNSISVLVAAVIIYLAVNKVTDKPILGLYAFGVFLLNPITLWQVSQPLAEASVTPFVAGAVAVCASGYLNAKRLLFIAIIFGLAYMARPVFLPVLTLIPLAYLLLNYRKDKMIKSLIYFSLLVLTVFILLKLKFFVFGEALIDLKAMLMSGVHGRGGMHAYLFPADGVIDWDLVLKKFINNIRMQFWPGEYYLLLFYIPFDLMSLLLFYKIFKLDRIKFQVISLALILVGIHFATIMIHQNQFRYMLVPLPAVLVGCILVIDNNFDVSAIALKRVLVVLSIGFFLFSIPMTIKSRSDVQKDFQLRQQIEQKILPIVGKADQIICVPTGHAIIEAYTLRPRPVIEFPSDGSAEYLSAVINLSHPDWLLCDIDVMKRLFPEKKWGKLKIVSQFQRGANKIVLVRLTDI